MRSVYKKASEKYKDWGFILDDEASGDVHKLWIAGETIKIHDFLVLDEHTNKTEPIGAKSGIIEKIPKKFSTLRIFAAILRGNMTSKTNRRKLASISHWCDEEFKKGG